MGRRLILDTTALIDAERGVALGLYPDDDIAIAAVSLAEFGRGVHTAKSTQQAKERQRTFDLLAGGRSPGSARAVNVLDYTAETARNHARLLAHTKESGQPRGAHDLIIAAHARQSGRRIFSRDAKAKFGGLPGVLTTDDD